jgi:hypothetical protein
MAAICPDMPPWEKAGEISGLVPKSSGFRNFPSKLSKKN